MKYIYSTLIIFLLSAITFSLAAQDIVDAKKANELSKKGEALLISAQPASSYSKVHAMGALNMDPALLVNSNQMLISSVEIAEILGSKGISSSNSLIIYDDGSMKAAGRLYWTLKYLGATDVKVLDGGMKAWRISRLPVTKNPTIVKKGSFIPKVNKQYLAEFATVKNALQLKSYAILDVRSPEEYSDPAGHIPGAINIEFTNVLNTDGTLKSISELQELFAGYGINANQKIIVYCKSSVRAGIVFLALHSSLKYPSVMVYDGAFIEWQQRAPEKTETE